MKILLYPISILIILYCGTNSRQSIVNQKTVEEEKETVTVKLHNYSFSYQPKGTDTVRMVSPNGRQQILPCEPVPENEYAVRRHSIEDYNFDGYKDIAFSVPDQGMGVYHIFDIWLYHPKTKTFSQMKFNQATGANCSCFCDITIDKKNRQLHSSCRGGARWWTDVYTFNKQGKLKFLKSKEAEE